MRKEERIYRRLPGKKIRFVGGREKLYTGPDHLLQVKSIGIAEDYRRFYYQDIKYLHIEKTMYGLIENLIVSSLFLLSGIAGYYLWTRVGPPTLVFNIIPAIFLLYLLKNIINGGSCRCWIETDIQRERLDAVNRLRPAKKLFKRLVPLIEGKQGQLLRDDFVKVIQQPAGNTTPRRAQSRPLSATKKISRSGHRILYILLTTTSIVGIGALFYHTLPVIVLMASLISGIGIFSIAAIAKQTKSNLKKSIKSLTWAVLIIVICSFAIGYIEMIVGAIKTIEHPDVFDQLWMLKAFARIDPFESPFTLCADLFLIISYMICGLSGLFLLKQR